jgi:hypothetical protein
MGAGSSAATTHDGALKATGNVRRFCDEIMKYMIERLNINDFYRLASRTECNKYVIFLANKLDTTFRGLSFAPARGSAGKLYFQPIDKLKAPSAKEKAERESLCLFLAYFYIRIFQIYGAIALTLVDDANVVSKAARNQGFNLKSIQFDREIDFYGPPGAPNPLPRSGWSGLLEGQTDKTFESITPYRQTRRNSLRTPERESYYRNGIMIGGATTSLSDEKLGKFKLFKGLVKDTRIEKLQIMPRADKVEDGGYLFNVPNFKGSFRLNPRGGFTDSDANEANATLFFDTPTGAKTNVYAVEVSIVTGAGRRESGNYLKIREVQHKALVDDLNRKLAYKGQGYSTDKMRNLSESELDRVFESIYGVRNSEFRFEEINYTYKIFVKSRSEGIDIGKFLVSLKSILDQELGLKRRNSSQNGTRRPNRNTIAPVSLEEAIKTVFDFKPINALRVDRPIALCSARALQLLGNTMGDTFTPAICSQQFLYQEKDGKVVPRSTAVPDMDKSILDSDGIQLLTQLFYDDSRFREYKITKSPISMNEYMEFLIKMTKLFQDTNDTSRITQYKSIIGENNPAAKKAKGELYTAEDIKDEKIKDVCNTYSKKPIEIKSAQGSEVIQKAAQLFGAQVAHAARCGKILKQLFTIVTVSGVQSIVINKNIFIKGINEVNRINQLARHTLVAYYENCEKLYREGVATIVKEEKPKEQGEEQEEEQEQEQKQQKTV